MFVEDLPKLACDVKFEGKKAHVLPFSYSEGNWRSAVMEDEKGCLVIVSFSPMDEVILVDDQK